MRNMCLGITAIVVTVGMASVGAQGRNFSGSWVVDSEKTMAAMQSAMGDAAGAAIAQSGGGGGRGGAIGGVISAGGGGVGGGGGAVVRSGSGVAAAGSGGGTMVSAGGGGGRGGVVGAASATVITLDATTFSTDIGGIHTSYPLNGTEVTVQLRNTEARAKASWKGDTLVIEQTIESSNGPVTSTTSWFLEGDSLVRETTRKTYYKRR